MLIYKKVYDDGQEDEPLSMTARLQDPFVKIVVILSAGLNRRRKQLLQINDREGEVICLKLIKFLLIFKKNFLYS